MDKMTKYSIPYSNEKKEKEQVYRGEGGREDRKAYYNFVHFVLLSFSQ